MKETFDSVWGSVKDRFTNPFLGTFLFVWIVRNWYLVYGLFIFDKECTMDDKLNYVKDYFNGYNVYLEFIQNTWWTLKILVVIYIILIFVNFLNRAYKLAINKSSELLDKIPVASKEHYLKLNIEFKNLSKKYKELSSENNQNITEIETLENNMLSLEKDIQRVNEKYYSYVSIFINSYVKDCVLFKNTLFKDSMEYQKLNIENTIPLFIIENSIYESIIEINHPDFIFFLEYYYLDSIKNTGSRSQRIKREERYALLKNTILLLDDENRSDIQKSLKNLLLIEQDFNERISFLGTQISKKLFTF
ncbi:hypothetical protein [Myroides odoratimimus]|uniref:hypothetical protein n=1 Tax=Myroides odoratimimus TaxID=76832 RepID=UPI002578B601|nr:hypothetical protein [Myroides odoratimimus]MDM1536369.1 hypothetical protein [Myroides odoratimimus]MDM1676033.1 hypothetical protein [Myroides odoratimimus]